MRAFFRQEKGRPEPQDRGEARGTSSDRHLSEHPTPGPQIHMEDLRAGLKVHHSPQVVHLPGLDHSGLATDLPHHHVFLQAYW